MDKMLNIDTLLILNYKEIEKVTRQIEGSDLEWTPTSMKAKAHMASFISYKKHLKINTNSDWIIPKIIIWEGVLPNSF